MLFFLQLKQLQLFLSISFNILDIFTINLEFSGNEILVSDIQLPGFQSFSFLGSQISKVFPIKFDKKI